MKFKYIKFMIAFAFLIVLIACGGNEAEETPDQEDSTEETAVNSNDVNIALIAHSPESSLDDGSFNQGAWDGIQRFLSNHGGEANFFQAHEGSDEARIDVIEDAINTGGANILVLPGVHFETALYETQELFPETTFVLLDASPKNADDEVVINRNVAAIHYAEEEAGFLAGYAAVMEGYRELGFMGGIAVPAVIRFGHGFVQGADYAAASLDLSEGDVTINFTYLGGFAPDPNYTVTAAAWFESGTEVIFTAAGGAGGSVMSAAENAGTSVIGVDVDQAHLSDSVITSAIKGLDVSVYDILTDFMNGNFNGGRELRFDASIYGVGLAMESSNFTNFTEAQYEEIFSSLRDGEINVISSPELGNIPVSIVTLVEL